MLADYFRFFSQAFRSIAHTGALFPTSRTAALELIHPLHEAGVSSPRRILEIGPGDGAVTVHILESMKLDDELVLCEMNPRFMELLKQRLEKNSHYRNVRERVSFHLGAIQDLPADTGRFDIIVCAIPYLNLPSAVALSIFEKIASLCNSNTIYTHYEYAGLRKLGMLFGSPSVRARLSDINTFLRSLFTKHLARRTIILRNLPPVIIYRLERLHDFKFTEDL